MTDPYGTYGHAIMHPDPKIRDKARRYVDGQLPDLPPAVEQVGDEDGREQDAGEGEHGGR